MANEYVPFYYRLSEAEIQWLPAQRSSPGGISMLDTGCSILDSDAVGAASAATASLGKMALPHGCLF
jgi:hypothetical protein